MFHLFKNRCAILSLSLTDSLIQPAAGDIDGMS